MRIRLYAVVGVVGLACLVFDVLAVGAAALRHPAVAAQAHSESPLAQTYVVTGWHLLHWVPAMKAPASALADACFGDAYAEVAAQPRVALEVLLDESDGLMSDLARAAYWGAPILLLAFVPLFWLRPRTVHLIGGNRR